MQETATQVLIRVSKKWYRIQHLDSDTRKRLMLLSDEEFDVEIQKLLKPAA
jgi:hypothetical protein